MTQEDIVRAIAAETKLTAPRVRETLALFTQSIRQSMIRDETLRIPTLGTFATSRTSARAGRDLRTGAPVEIPAGRRALFRPTRDLRRALNPRVPGAGAQNAAADLAPAPRSPAPAAEEAS